MNPSGQKACAIRGPYKPAAICEPGLVGNAIRPALQSSANQRRIIAAEDGPQPEPCQLIFIPSLPQSCRCPCGSAHCGQQRTGGSMSTSRPETRAMARLALGVTVTWAETTSCGSCS